MLLCKFHLYSHSFSLSVVGSEEKTKIIQYGPSVEEIHHRFRRDTVSQCSRTANSVMLYHTFNPKLQDHKHLLLFKSNVEISKVQFVLKNHDFINRRIRKYSS